MKNRILILIVNLRLIAMQTMSTNSVRKWTICYPKDELCDHVLMIQMVCDQIKASNSPLINANDNDIEPINSTLFKYECFAYSTNSVFHFGIFFYSLAHFLSIQVQFLIRLI